MKERGATREEVEATVHKGAKKKAKLGRTIFTRNFAFGGVWRGKPYNSKKLEVIAVPEKDWLVLTVIVKFF